MGTQCVNGVCAVQFRQAASIDNTGGMTITGGVPYAGVPAKINAVFAAWTAGRVSCTTNWNSVPVASFSSPVGLGALNGSDRNNNIIWLSGSNWTHLANELALTTTTYFTSNREIFDGDMEMNNNVSWSTTAAANTYDIETVVVHEAGHFLGLNHTPNSASVVMYPLVTIGAAKRTLTPVDENDVCTVYPGTGGGQGVPCTTSTECSSTGRVCEGIAGGTSKICTNDCASAGATTCPSGFTCQASTAGFACLPQIGAPDQCKFCQTGGECSSGLCLRFDSGAANGVTFCSVNCTENAQCGAGYTCQLPDGFCVPNAMTCTNQCQNATQCAAGYTCTGGTCTPRGDTGDSCAVSLVCRGCNVCTRESASSDALYCRACCAGQGRGGFCNACANAACGAGNTCVALTTGNSSVCLPGTSAPTTCAACNGTQCANGLQCVVGRCRAPCNPAAPGTCTACFSLAGGGSCACADEIAGEGEACGQVNNTLAVCGAGLACIGTTSPTCRARCDINVPSSCRTGQTCQQMSGVGVCVPGTEGSKCAPCTNVNGCNSGLTCYLGRCYEPCNVNSSNTCSSCVQSMSSGVGVCGCPDQISTENGPCGTQPEVRACQTGTKCLNSLCRAPCNPQMVDACPVGADCRELTAGAFFCQDQIAAGGGGGGGTTSGGGGGRSGGAGGSSATGGGGGGGGGGTMDLGCGCGASGGPLGALVLGVWSLLRRRRTC